jgi:hypothetical protein
MLPIMGTAKKIIVIRPKLDFWERREKQTLDHSKSRQHTNRKETLLKARIVTKKNNSTVKRIIFDFRKWN